MKKFLIIFILFSILQTYGISQNCLPNGIEFTTQTEIDNFQSNYPNCTEILGSVSINGDDITDLNGLSILISIGGGLNISGNQLLINLTGLENLTSISGDLTISFNEVLNSLSGLENIDSETISRLEITYNYSLSNCEAQSICEYLLNPNGSIRIAYNSSGCNNPSEIANVCGITLPCLPFGEYTFYSQMQIDSFQTNYPDCTELNGYVRIRGDISNLNGLNVINRINGLLSIEYNHNLINLVGLENVTFMNGLWIWENHSLIDLTGLSALDSLGSGIWIKDNYALEYLSGLDSLTSVGGNIWISGNTLLTNLFGLNNVDYSSIGNLFIYDNPLLSSCEALSICNYLASPNGEITIYNNNSGCNNLKEVEQACTVFINDKSSFPEFTIYPNPAKSEIIISNNKGNIINELNIYNRLGQQIIKRKEIKNKVDVSSLKQGIYIIEIRYSTTKTIRKLIIKE